MKFSEEQGQKVLELWRNKKENKMTQADIARATKIPPTIVSRIISGIRPVRARTYTSGQLIEVAEGISISKSTVKIQERIEQELKEVSDKLIQISIAKRHFENNLLVSESLSLLEKQVLARQERLKNAFHVIETKVPKNTLISYHNQRREDHVYIVASWYDESRRPKKISLGSLGFEL